MQKAIKKKRLVHTNSIQLSRIVHLSYEIIQQHLRINHLLLTSKYSLYIKNGIIQVVKPSAYSSNEENFSRSFNTFTHSASLGDLFIRIGNSFNMIFLEHPRFQFHSNSLWIVHKRYNLKT